MAYTSEIAILIGSNPKQVQQFVAHILSLKIEDDDSLLPLFKTIQIEADFSVFAFYQSSIDWYEGSAIKTIWEILQEEADKEKLSYICYRLGENVEDIELIESGVDEYFDHCLINLISIERHFNLADKLVCKLIN